MALVVMGLAALAAAQGGPFVEAARVTVTAPVGPAARYLPTPVGVIGAVARTATGARAAMAVGRGSGQRCAAGRPRGGGAAADRPAPGPGAVATVAYVETGRRPAAGAAALNGLEIERVDLLAMAPVRRPGQMGALAKDRVEAVPTLAPVDVEKMAVAPLEDAAREVARANRRA